MIVYGVLIEHPGTGLILFETGCHDEMEKYWGPVSLTKRTTVPCVLLAEPKSLADVRCFSSKTVRLEESSRCSDRGHWPFDQGYQGGSHGSSAYGLPRLNVRLRIEVDLIMSRCRPFRWTHALYWDGCAHLRARPRASKCPVVLVHKGLISLYDTRPRNHG
jgi:hypothetical protein